MYLNMCAAFHNQVSGCGREQLQTPAKCDRWKSFSSWQMRHMRRGPYLKCTTCSEKEISPCDNRDVPLHFDRSTLMCNPVVETLDNHLVMTRVCSTAAGDTHDCRWAMHHIISGVWTNWSPSIGVSVGVYFINRWTTFPSSTLITPSVSCSLIIMYISPMIMYNLNALHWYIPGHIAPPLQTHVHMHTSRVNFHEQCICR